MHPFFIEAIGVISVLSVNGYDYFFSRGGVILAGRRGNKRQSGH